MLRREFILSSMNNLALTSSLINNPNSTFNSTNQELIISGIGDVTLGYNFDLMFNKLSNNYGEEYALNYPFNKVSEIFSKSDIVIANLEGTFTSSNKSRPKEFSFKGVDKYSECLIKSNIGIVNLANNHFMDYYSVGSNDTIDVLESREIKYCGGGRNINDSKLVKIIEKNDIKVGFVGYAKVGYSPCASKNDAGTNPYNQYIFEEINSFKKECDILVISIHWGVERDSIPNNTEQFEARKIIDNGADIIFAHHPHVIQGIEEYNNGIIFYSLGNFVFGGNSYPNDRDSFIAEVKCSKKGVLSHNVIPVITHPSPFNFQPYIPVDSERIIKKIKERSILIK